MLRSRTTMMLIYRRNGEFLKIQSSCSSGWGNYRWGGVAICYLFQVLIRDIHLDAYSEDSEIREWTWLKCETWALSSE